MPLSSRPWSLNSYCLTKLWYRCGCLNLRVGGSSTIMSTVKSWLCQDMLEKPQEMVTFRQTELGGLGLHCVKTRAMAMLIHTFLSQAINPKYNNNQYHTCSYNINGMYLRRGISPAQESLHTTPQISSKLSKIYMNIPHSMLRSSL